MRKRKINKPIVEEFGIIKNVLNQAYDLNKLAQIPKSVQNIVENACKFQIPRSFQCILENTEKMKVINYDNYDIHDKIKYILTTVPVQTSYFKINQRYNVYIEKVYNFKETLYELTSVSEFIKSKLPKVELYNFEIDEELYKKWGEYGWSILMYEEANYIYEDVKSEQEADKYMKKILNKQHIKIILKDIVNKGKNKEYEEILTLAIKSFKLNQYHASVLILFSIIDRVLSENLCTEGQHKPTGYTGVKKLQKHLGTKFDEETNKLMYLISLNLYEVLDKFFIYPENLTKYRDQLNRNNLSHGWQIKKVTRIDALKLFLVINNLQLVLE